jgi:PAS domain-containing protein
MVKTSVKPRHNLEAEIQALQARLAEAEDLLYAIQHGEVDALLVRTSRGDEVYTLQSADYPYRVLIQEMGEGAVTVQPDGVILYCNPRFAQLLNKPVEQIFGTSIIDHVSAPERPIMLTLLQQAGKGEVTLQTAQGAAVPVHISVAALHLNDVQALSILITDLTLHKRHEDLMAGEQLARSIVDQAADVLIVCGPDWRIVQANQAARSLCADPLGQLFDQAYPLSRLNHDHQLDPIALSAIASGGVVRSFEVSLIGPDGAPETYLLSTAPLSTGSGVNGYVVTLTDVSARKQMEQALRLSEARFRIALQNSPIAVYNQDSDLRYTWAYPPEQDSILGKTDVELLNNSEATLLTGWKRFVLKTGQSLRSEIELTQRGETRCYDLLIEPLHDAQGRVSGVTCATIDITGRRLAEESRLLSEARFRQLFEFAPVALCEVDCLEVRDQLLEWRMAGVINLRQHLTQHPELIQLCVELTKVLDVNQAALELYGVQDKTWFAKQQNPDHWLPPSSLIEIFSLLFGEQTQHESEILLTTADGFQKRARLRACLVSDQLQRLSRILISLMDV